MAVATGTAALIGAGIAAAGQFGGAAINASAAGRAGTAQAKAAANAMKHASYREGLNDKRYAERVQDYRQHYDDWRGMTLSQLGMDDPRAGAAAAPVVAPGAEGAPGAGTIADLATSGDWADWRRYGA